MRESAQATVEATRRFRLFVATLLAAGALFVAAFVVGLPVLVLRPQKFALCFTLESVRDAYIACGDCLEKNKQKLAMPRGEGGNAMSMF